jgi:hypothetical protein
VKNQHFESHLGPQCQGTDVCGAHSDSYVYPHVQIGCCWTGQPVGLVGGVTCLAVLGLALALVSLDHLSRLTTGCHI